MIHLRYRYSSIFLLIIDVLSILGQVDASLPRKAQVQIWSQTHVFPKPLQYDLDWFHEQDPQLLAKQWLARKASLRHSKDAAWNSREWLYTRIWYLCRLSGELVFTAMRRYVTKDQTCLFCGIPLTLAHLIHVSVLNPTLTIRTIGSRLKHVSQPLPLCKRAILVLGTVLGCLAMLGPKYYMADLVVCFAILFPP